MGGLWDRVGLVKNVVVYLEYRSGVDLVVNLR